VSLSPEGAGLDGSLRAKYEHDGPASIR